MSPDLTVNGFLCHPPTESVLAFLALRGTLLAFRVERKRLTTPESVMSLVELSRTGKKARGDLSNHTIEPGPSPLRRIMRVASGHLGRLSPAARLRIKVSPA